MGMIFGKETVAEPSYKVLMNCMKASTLPYEIRQYSDRYAVQTMYPIGASTNVPFRKLAQYIGVFGTPNNNGEKTIDMTAPVAISTTSTGNDGSKTPQPVSIAMTAPVAIKTTTERSDKQQVMTFYLPAIYNEHPDTIPQPIDPDVTILCVPGAIGAVHRFSGSMGDNAIVTARDKAHQLRAQLVTDGIHSLHTAAAATTTTTTDDNEKDSFYEVWQYNPPFTIPAFRRNEIWVELTTEQFQELVTAKQQLEQEKSTIN